MRHLRETLKVLHQYPVSPSQATETYDWTPGRSECRIHFPASPAAPCDQRDNILITGEEVQELYGGFQEPSL